jgi:hypothetical protein
MWVRGDQIVLRYRWGDRLAFVHPVTVVSDTPDCIALYLAMGTPIKAPVGHDGLPIPRSLPYEERSALPWRLGDGIWREHSVLWLMHPGAAHAIGLFWRGEKRAFVGWYGDLQSPLVRTATGFDTVDHVLDVDIAADGSWEWKDEDEFAAAQCLGHISPEQAAAIRAEGEAVIAALEPRKWPFNSGWETWQPDPTWPLPTLPSEWNGA